MTCSLCGQLATIHLTEIKGGQKTSRHLCVACAAKSAAASPGPISAALSRFVREHLPEGERTEGKPAGRDTPP